VRIRRVALIAMLAALPLLAACGGGDDPISQAKFAEEIEESGLDGEIADCIAEEVFANLSEDEREELTGDALEADEAPSEAIDDALSLGMEKCMGLGEGDVAGAIPAEVCEEWSAWTEDGDDAHLDAIQAALVGVPAGEEIDEAIGEMRTMETDTADQQAAYEGAYDFVNGELQASGGCTFDE
jgi:hypothetical protein